MKTIEEKAKELDTTNLRYVEDVTITWCKECNWKGIGSDVQIDHIYNPIPVGEKGTHYVVTLLYKCPECGSEKLINEFGLYKQI